MQKLNGIEIWVFGPFTSSGVIGSRNTTFRELDLFPSSGEGGEKTLSFKTVMTIIDQL
jgi:hypothetical protein